MNLYKITLINNESRYIESIVPFKDYVKTIKQDGFIAINKQKVIMATAIIEIELTDAEYLEELGVFI